MGHIVCLPLNELKVIRANRGSGAAGFVCVCECICVFTCCVVEGWRGAVGWRRASKQFAKEQPGETQARPNLFWIAPGPTFHRQKYKQRTGTANPAKCKIKKGDDSGMTP